jgi:MFS family permease
LLSIYAICGFDDFFVTTHLVAFAQDRGIDAFLAGTLLALMGVTGLLGVLAAGVVNDRVGPIYPTAASFAVRVVVCALLVVDQSVISIIIFAVVFGATFLVTAPLTIVFVKDLFGTKHIGTFTGLVFMTHHVSGGIGAYVGAFIFDTTERYDYVFALMLIISSLALILTLCLRSRLAFTLQR